MKREITISEYFHNCPFFNVDMDGMSCIHPYWEDKEPYENMIITQDNSKGLIPEECPLQQEELILTYKLKTK